MALISLTLFSLFVTIVYADVCGVKNDSDQQQTLYDLGSVNDWYRGVIREYETQNVMKVTEVATSKNVYLNWIWNEKTETLTFETGQNFDKYEMESTSLNIQIILKFECAKSTLQKPFTLKINDTNNHLPEFNQANYQYVFGTTIPTGYVFTDLLPIQATDIDITNSEITFEIPINDYIKIEQSTQTRYESKNYSLKLIASQELSAPFHEEYELTATDSGSPPLTSTATIVVKVDNPEKWAPETNSTESQPPIFEKNLYLAYYTASDKTEIEMEEAITIKCGVTNSTFLKQTGYEEYVSLSLENATITVNLLKKLPQNILESQFIVIEIAAVNEGFENIPGRTALLIEFSDSKPNNECNILILGQEMGYPMLLLLSGILAIILINICVLAMFFNKRNKVHMQEQQLQKF